MVIYAFEFFELCDILFDLKFIWDEGDFSVKVYHLLWNTFLMASLELISIGLKVAFSTVIVKFMCSHRDDSKGMGKKLLSNNFIWENKWGLHSEKIHEISRTVTPKDNKNILMEFSSRERKKYKLKWKLF